MITSEEMDIIKRKGAMEKLAEEVKLRLTKAERCIYEIGLENHDDFYNKTIFAQQLIAEAKQLYDELMKEREG